MIGGTYTALLSQAPVSLWAVGLVTIVWTGALAGASLRLFWPGRFERFGVVAYLALGWSAALAIKPLFQALPVETMALVVAGRRALHDRRRVSSLAQPQIPERDLARLRDRRRRLPFLRRFAGGRPLIEAYERTRAQRLIDSKRADMLAIPCLIDLPVFRGDRAGPLARKNAVKSAPQQLEISGGTP